MVKRRSGFHLGVAALTTLLGLGALITLVGVALAALAFFEGTIGLTQAKSQEAVLLARSGIQDALLRLARDKTYGSPSATSTLTFAGGSADVTVDDDNPITGQTKIISTGAVSNRQRRLEVIVTVDQNTGMLTIVSSREISL